MITGGDAPRDLSRLLVPLGGSLEATGDLFEPYRLVDADGVVLVPAAAYFRELAACGRQASTHRSYGMALLRWWRFLRAVGVGWDQATRAEARDFCSWIQLADKPARAHWQPPAGPAQLAEPAGRVLRLQPSHARFHPRRRLHRGPGGAHSATEGPAVRSPRHRGQRYGSRGRAACTSGRRPAHGCAASSCAASRMSVASSPKRPRKCRSLNARKRLGAGQGAGPPDLRICAPAG